MFQDFIHNAKIQKLLSSKEKFDIVVTEFVGGQEFVLLLGHIFKAPIIGIQTFVTNNIVNDVFGNPLSPSYIPDVCSSFSDKMSFYERVLNSIYVFRGIYYVYYQKYLPHLERNMRRHFPNAPPLLDMVKNISINFVNDHLTADYSRPRTPNLIPVAGIHIEDERQLPEVRFLELLQLLGRYYWEHE